MPVSYAVGVVTMSVRPCYRRTARRLGPGRGRLPYPRGPLVPRRRIGFQRLQDDPVAAERKDRFRLLRGHLIEPWCRGEDGVSEGEGSPFGESSVLHVSFQ